MSAPSIAQREAQPSPRLRSTRRLMHEIQFIIAGLTVQRHLGDLAWMPNFAAARWYARHGRELMGCKSPV